MFLLLLLLLNMCSSVPRNFYQLCRLCLSQQNDKDGLSIFDNQRHLPRKIMTCLSILVSDSSFLTALKYALIVTKSSRFLQQDETQ